MHTFLMTETSNRISEFGFHVISEFLKVSLFLWWRDTFSFTEVPVLKRI